MKSLLTVRYIRHCQGFFFIKQRKNLTLSETTFFSHYTHQKSSICACFYLSVFEGWNIYTEAVNESPPAIDWFINCPLVVTSYWQDKFSFPPLHQHSTNTYLNKSKNITSAHSFFLSEWNWQRNNPLLRVFSLSPLFSPLLKGLWTSASLVFLNKSLKNINSSCRL